MKAMYAYHCKVIDCSHISYSKDKAQWHIHDHSVALEEELSLPEPPYPEVKPTNTWLSRVHEWKESLEVCDRKIGEALKERIEEDKRTYFWKLPFGSKAPIYDCSCFICTSPEGTKVEAGIQAREKLRLKR